MSTERYPDEYFYSPLAAKIYHSYLWIITILLLAILPLYIYVILTQSKTLGTYKWFLLNHTIWSILFTFEISLTRPILLYPALAGYSESVFVRDSSSFISEIIWVGFILITAVFVTGGCIMTLVYRYAVIFKNKTGFLSSSKAIKLYVSIQVFITSTLLVGMVLAVSDGKPDYEPFPIKFDALRKFASVEPTFMYIDADVYNVKSGQVLCESKVLKKIKKSG